MSRWWRAYDEALDDPKLQRLGLEMVGAWFNLMCLASRHKGRLPSIEDVAFALRSTKTKAAAIVTRLTTAGLLDESSDGFAPHNWAARQYKSDASNSRVAAFRKRQSNGECNVTETVNETPPETEQRQSRSEQSPADADRPGPSSDSPYAFESGVIRLKQKDFDQWKRAYSHLDLAAELLALTEWASGQPRWFPAVSGALAKRNREVGIRIEQRKSEPAFKWNGIEGVI